jgi:hypothetical protein
MSDIPAHTAGTPAGEVKTDYFFRAVRGDTHCPGGMFRNKGAEPKDLCQRSQACQSP